jgi:uncharacterized protein
MLNYNRPFRILSIDGGGVRGIVALSILQWIEDEIIKKPIGTCFDMFAGTSTGGLIACGITVCDDNNFKNSKYSITQLKELYYKEAVKIFPERSGIKKVAGNVNDLFSAKHSKQGFCDLLETIFDNKRLTDCNKPIFIPSYDVDRLTPVYFTSRRIYPVSAPYISEPSANVKIIDICRATSSAPTYLPSHRFMHVDDANRSYNANCIDGGVFLNNPSMAAYGEVISNSKHPIYTNDPLMQTAIPQNNIYVLSIGTGKTNRNIIPRNENNWGKLKWIKPLINIMMESNSDTVDYQLQGVAHNRYLRINIDIEEKYAQMDDSRKETLDYLVQEVKKQIIENKRWAHQLHAFKNIAQL